MEEHELELGEKPRPSYRKKSGPKPKQSDDKLSYTVGFSVTRKEQEQLRAEHEIASAQSKITFANFLKGKVMQTKSVRKVSRKRDDLNPQATELLSISDDLALIRKQLQNLVESTAQMNTQLRLAHQKGWLNEADITTLKQLEVRFSHQTNTLEKLLDMIGIWYQE